MSWSLQLFGKVSKVAAALDAFSEKLTGASKVEYDAVKPHLIGAVNQNVDLVTEPLVSISASGHGSVDGTGKIVQNQCQVEVKRVYGDILI